MTGATNRDIAYVEHMLECVRRIESYTSDGRDAFFASTLIQDAAVRNLQTMAESSQRLCAETRALEPTVDWRAISGLRNILVHGYLGIDLAIVWETIERDLPDLRDGLTRLLERLSEQGSN